MTALLQGPPSPPVTGMPPRAKSVPKAAAAKARATSTGRAPAVKAAPAAKAAVKAAPKASAKAAAGAVEPAFAAEEEQRSKQAEEEHRRLEELQLKAEEARLRAEEEERKRKAEKEDGDVVFNYSMYNEKFPIKGGQTTAAAIDEVYCLSDVMPGCTIHLSTKPVEERYKAEAAGEIFQYLLEDPPGTFRGLEAGETYYVHVTEDEAEFLKSQERAKRAFAGVRSEATRGEGCSCIEGNPCGPGAEYTCLDWHNRFAVAKKHGWIGYQAK